MTINENVTTKETGHDINKRYKVLVRYWQQIYWSACMVVIVEELAPVTYALVCALILTFDLNKVPIGVTKKVGHVIGVMVIFPPSWKMAAIVG